MWPFRKWTLIGFADLGWTDLPRIGPNIDRWQRVMFYTSDNKRRVVPTNKAGYDRCMKASVFCFTECLAWERGGPLPKDFKRNAPEYTTTGNVIQLKAKE